MMKEKITEYIDKNLSKEEVEELLKDNPEALEYYHQILAMKETLTDMQLRSPDVSSKVVEKARRPFVFRYRYVLVTISVALIVSILFIKNYRENLALKEPEVTLKTAPVPPGGELYMDVTQQIDVEIKKSGEETVSTVLEEYGDIVLIEEGENEDSRHPPEEPPKPTKIIHYSIKPENIQKVMEELQKIEGAKVTFPEHLPYSSEERIEIIINLFEK